MTLLAAFFYTVSKMELIIGRQLVRDRVEAEQNYLWSREVDYEYLAPYVDMLPKHQDHDDVTIVEYRCLFFFFAVVYTASDEVLYVIDNGV